MYTLRILTISAIKMFVRNRQAMFFTFFTPLIIMGIFGLIGFDNVPKIQVGYTLPAPPNAATKQFIEQIKQVPAFEVTGGTEVEERRALAEGKRHLVLIIPPDLISQNQNAPKTIAVLKNSSQEQQAQTGISILNQFLNQATLNITNAPELFYIEVKDINVRNVRYIDFLVPGIVALAIMQMSVFSVAFVFADFKEKGILKRVLATPVKPSEFVASNVITRLMVALIQAAILLAIGVLVFNTEIVGSLWLILLITILGSIMFLGLGFTISGFAKTVESVPALANLVIFPMLFLGDTFFPIESMPSWLQSIAQFLPLTYFSDSLREVMVNGATAGEIYPNLFWMLGWSVILVVLANITFGLEEKNI